MRSRKNRRNLVREGIPAATAWNRSTQTRNKGDSMRTTVRSRSNVLERSIVAALAALFAGGEVEFLEPLEGADEWEAKKLLLRSAIPEAAPVETDPNAAEAAQPNVAQFKPRKRLA